MPNRFLLLSGVVAVIAPTIRLVDGFMPTNGLRYAKRLMARHRSTAHTDEYEFTVQYGEALELQVPIASNETMLAAMERIPALQGYIPHDCRKGTCLTCAARVVATPAAVVLETDDGLSPSVDLDRQYILPCSTKVQLDASKLAATSALTTTKSSSSVILALNDDHDPTHYDVWKQVYHQRLGRGHPDRSSAARAMRRYAERNVQTWMQQTEGALKQQTTSATSSVLDEDSVEIDEGALE